MNPPLISVIMPVYNAEKYLDESISSILNQSFNDFEFIIINDSSKDKSSKVINKYKRADKRIILLNNSKNLGVAKSRNKGMKIAKGKYIATFDADDISLPKRLEIQYNYLERHPEIFLIGGSAVIIDENGKKLGVFKKFDNYKKIRKKLLVSNPIVNSSVMMRNSENLFYRDKFDGADEYDLFLRLLSNNKKITNLEDFVVKYRITPNSISMNKRAKQEFFTKKIQEFFYQREKNGNDLYNELDINIIKGIKEDTDFDKIKLRCSILGNFQDNQMKRTRTEIKYYFSKYRFDKIFLIYYLLSFLPFGLIKSFRKLF